MAQRLSSRVMRMFPPKEHESGAGAGSKDIENEHQWKPLEPSAWNSYGPVEGVSSGGNTVTGVGATGWQPYIEHDVYEGAGRSSSNKPTFGSITSASYPSMVFQGHSGDQQLDSGAGGSLPTLSSPSPAFSHYNADNANPTTPKLSGEYDAQSKSGEALAFDYNAEVISPEGRDQNIVTPVLPDTRSSGETPTAVLTEPVVIAHTMATTTIVEHLGDHGCEDITELLDISTSSEWPISSGGFGDVYKVKLRDSTEVAVKTTRIHITSTEEGKKYLKHAARELHTWSKCRHPNVLELLGLAMFRGQIGMVSLWMENGSLPTYLSRKPEVDRCKISVQVSEGLAYLHSNGIVHGDLKGMNVLVSSDGVPMLTDFGNAVLTNQSLLFTATTSKTSISLRWTAPELLDPEEPSSPSKEADVYALGMTILETITGNVPYSEKSERSVMVCVWQRKSPSRPKEISAATEDGDVIWSLLVRCWAHEPEERPSVVEIIEVTKKVTSDGLRLIAR